MAQEAQFWHDTKEVIGEWGQDVSLFKTWAIVRGIPLYDPDMFYQDYRNEVEVLASNSVRGAEMWKWLIHEPTRGHTQESYQAVQRKAFGDTVDCTTWALKSAHHVLSFEEMARKLITEYEQIVEFGPGIGETARVILDMKFTGDYWLYDLPEVSRLSYYYLRGHSNVRRALDFKEVPQDKKTLFLSTWGFSEVPFEYRNEIARHFKGQDFFLAYQYRVFEYDNVHYFVHELPKVAGFTVERERAIMWGGGGSAYLYGASK